MRTVFLTDDGKAFMCGNFVKPYSGSNVTPYEISPDIDHPFLSSVAIGIDFLIFKCSKGSLLGMGNSFSIGLSSGENQSDTYIDDLTGLSLQENVVDVICGQRHAVALTDQHRIWACGNYQWKMLTSAADVGWTRLMYDNVFRLIGGENYYAFLSNEGGENKLEFFGTNKRMDPKAISKIDIVNVYGGIDYFIILTRENELILVRDAKNPCGSIGSRGKNKLKSLVTLGRGTQDISNNFDVTCGWDHVMAVLYRGVKSYRSPPKLLHEAAKKQEFIDIHFLNM
ncbi:GTPase regulator [Acrasis kona]|uniref:GTPase regulator n=1 Tax=Acrasis kona TaxID=1008807 RepID=A0AAW2YZN1_9EUKA